LASQVAWGSSPDPKTWPKENVVSGFTWDTPPGAINAPGPQRMHEAYLCDLTPGTTYYYRVGGGPAGKEVWSDDVYSFTTTPKTADAPITIAINGDSRGQHNDAWRILESRIHAMHPTLQLFSGDMIDLALNQAEWEEWIDNGWKGPDGKISALGEILTFAAHGNHDNHNSLYYGNVVLPQDLDNFPQYPEQFFSVDVGPAHIVVIDDSWVIDTQHEDYRSVIGSWLEADLSAAEANRTNVPWIIVAHHHPEYSSSTHGKDADVLRGRAFLGPIWDKHHVDLSISGHDHDYERSLPLTGPTDNPTVKTDPKEGTIYLVAAGAGAEAYPSTKSSFTALPYDYTAGKALGLYAMLKVSRASLTIEAHSLQTDGTDPVIDTLTVTK
jgi:hypothetical protein